MISRGPLLEAIAGTDVWLDQRRRVAELRTRYGFARQLLDFYGALLPVQEKAFIDAATAQPPADAIAAYAAELVFPGVVDVSVAAGPDRLRVEVIDRVAAQDPRDIVAAWMRGEDQPAVDRFLARGSLGPVLEAIAEARAACEGPRDARHCPECGGPPQLSFFDRSSDDLASGPRKLLCARCGATWGYPRMTCAACGEDTGARLPVFSEHGTTSGEHRSVVRGLPTGKEVARQDAVFPHMRIEACDTCRHYLLSVDLATDRTAVPIVDELAAIPLDLYARERGYTKITTNLMGF